MCDLNLKKDEDRVFIVHDKVNNKVYRYEKGEMEEINGTISDVDFTYYEIVAGNELIPHIRRVTQLTEQEKYGETELERRQKNKARRYVSRLTMSFKPIKG